MTDKRFSAIPMTLETPGGDSWFRKNLEILKSMQSKK
jgi:endonuclease IV